MENIIMFTIGTIIFTLYLLGYVMMINKAHSSQQEDLENDPVPPVIKIDLLLNIKTLNLF